jgi:hypothetical protein
MATTGVTATDSAADVAARCAACVSTTDAPGIDAATSISISDVAVSASIAVAITASPTAATPTPVIPGAHADEQTAGEPFRPVVAIRRTGIRVIVVITPVADWGAISDGCGHDFRADAYSNGDLGIGCRNERESQKCCD